MTRILVVDDEVCVRVTVGEILRDAGYEVAVAEDADEAMEVLEAGGFGLVITDIIMPRRTGVALLEAIKGSSPDLQVILMTGQPDVETAAAGLRGAAIDYLTKPIGKDRLLQSAARAIRLGTLVRERTRLAEEQAGTLRRLAVRLHDVREEERTAIARELHDVLGQALTAIKMDLAWVKTRCGDEDAAIAERVTAAAELVGDTIHVVRRISSELRPPALDDLGLFEAVTWYCGALATRAELVINVAHPNTLPEVPPRRATAVFRIIQESLTNVVRHANASTVQVHMGRTGDNLEVRILDDGYGIPAEKISGECSLGILGMRERAASFGGSLHVRRRATGGTDVTVIAPLGGATNGPRTN